MQVTLYIVGTCGDFYNGQLQFRQVTSFLIRQVSLH